MLRGLAKKLLSLCRAESRCSTDERVSGIRTMTFEKWIEEVSKTKIVQGEEAEHLHSRIFDKFGEEYEEEDPNRPPCTKH
jgi:hypothetical protein